MKLVLLLAFALPAILFAFVLISLYKLGIKKKNLTPFYTPFDEITGHSQVKFHEEQIILAVDEEQGDDKDKK